MEVVRRSWLLGAVAMVAIGSAGWVTHAKIRTLDSAAGWVRHTDEVRLALERALSTLKDAETGTRGYIIARDDRLLAPHFEALQRLDSDLERIARLVADNAQQHARAEELRRLANARLQPLKSSVVKIQSGLEDPGAEEKRRILLSSNALMNAVRAHVRMMQQEQEELLTERLAAVASARTTAIGTAAATTGIALALVLTVLLVDARANTRLRRSEQGLATTLQSIGDAVIATDEHGKVTYLNPVAAELTGWAMDEARSQPLETVFSIIGEDTGQPVESPVARVLREGTVVGLANHTLLIRRDGTRFPIEDSGAPIKDVNGTIHGVVLVFKDASQQRASAAALASSEERLRLAIDSAQLGTWDSDPVAGTVDWNPQLYRIMGLEPGSPVTREIARSLVVPEELPGLLQAIERGRQDRQPFAIEYHIHRANDSAERTLTLLGHFLFDDEGNAIRLLGIITDVTEERRIEQRVRQAQKLDALGTLAGGIAHDFNNILSILRGNLVLIESDLPADHPAASAIAEMNRACARARDLVRQILTFGRQQDQDRKIISLADTLNDALGLLRSTVPATIQIDKRFANAVPMVLADSSQIHQIVMNLGINASQAIGPGKGTITVELDEIMVDASLASHLPDLHEGRYVRLRFSDTGGGMTREVFERAFEPFFTTKPLGTGTGLGLAVVRGIVRSHDGAIALYSEPGKGTQFVLYFPAVEGAAAEAQQPASVTVRGEGQRVLYIDDEEALVMLARRLLERLGYQVAGFSDASEALAAFEAAPETFDLVLSDLSMPGTTGMEVARRVLEIRPDIPVLLASGYLRTEDVELARSMGVRDVIWKPATINEMGELLGRMLAKMMPHA